ncbi:MAG: pullulanase-type alpha-1,6-glucosidase [Chloroflexota bacterium]
MTKNLPAITASNLPKGSLSTLRAHWVRRDTILWNTANSYDFSYTLFSLPRNSAEKGPGNAEAGIEIPLEFKPDGMEDSIRLKFPHLASCMVFKLPPESLDLLPAALKGQLGVVVRDAGGGFVDLTGIQIPGVLDDLYTYSGPLGVTFDGNTPSLQLWAPTARSVSLHLFDNSSTSIAEKLPMQWDPQSGVWSLVGKPNWVEKFYLFNVEVYVPATGRIEKNLTTDPYSHSLSTNSVRSQIVNLQSTSLKPRGWDSFVKPALAAPEDIVVYELHVRDFSIYDQSVPQDLRGTFKAFTQRNSQGMKHLKLLAEAGLTHIHLLPVFDIASVNEEKSSWRSVDDELLASYPPDSDHQQMAVAAIKDSDGFNWGYDPYHFTTPEGSYSTDPNGTPRIREFREMVHSLSQSGLRVVMDLVYNHTFAGGLDDKSVLDKIVPGYYYRLDGEGRIERSTCCSNTASEHAMMRKLMIDSILTWAKEYRVDGFRFDLMGHHMLADIRAVRAALDALTPEKDGVDGKQIYVYGEGWNFGEVANNARGVNAVQQNIGGTGIGAFNDRLRDAVRGGSHFDFVFEQGFVTGLFYQPNSSERRGYDYQKWRLFEYTDWIKISLAGNLYHYELTRSNGDKVPAHEVIYNGYPSAYALDPQENVVYVAAHDNETLWDILQVKSSSELSLSDRVRMNNLALSLVAFSQGIPFFHCGDDILRSKSLDRNSYNSGDWFNRIDWSYETNNWGVGLPSEGREKWDIFRPLLSNPAIKPGRAEIMFAAATFREFLKIRKSSPLFRLQTADPVQRCVKFLNSGPWQIPGLIVMQLNDEDYIDPHYKSIVVLFNACPNQITFADESFINQKFKLHPVQDTSPDATLSEAVFDVSIGKFTIPGRTTAVFVQKHK